MLVSGCWVRDTDRWGRIPHLFTAEVQQCTHSEGQPAIKTGKVWGLSEYGDGLLFWNCVKTA